MKIVGKVTPDSGSAGGLLRLSPLLSELVVFLLDQYVASLHGLA